MFINQKGPPLLHFSALCDIFRKKIFFRKFQVFFQKNVLRFLSLSYSADLRRSRLVYHFFHQLTKRVTPRKVTADKIWPMRCPTGRSTEIIPQLYPIFGFICSFWGRNVSEFFSTLAHHNIGANVYSDGSCQNATAFQEGSRYLWPDHSFETVRIDEEMIFFSAFSYFAHIRKKILDGLFSCTRHLLYKQKMRALKLPAYKNTECPRCFNSVHGHSSN